jgi:hypothetical protein
LIRLSFGAGMPISTAPMPFFFHEISNFGNCLNPKRRKLSTYVRIDFPNETQCFYPATATLTSDLGKQANTISA